MRGRPLTSTAALGLVAVLALGVLGCLGTAELAAYLAPLASVAVLLLSGRFIAEDRIVRRWRGRPAPGRPRAASARWSTGRQLALTSLLDRSPRSERGPPWAVPAAA